MENKTESKIEQPVSQSETVAKKRKKFYQRKRFWFLLVFLLLLATGSYGYYQVSRSSGQIKYSTEEVRRGKLVQTVSATGSVEPAKDIEMNFSISGKLTYLPIKEGDQVRSGQILAKLNSAGLAALASQYQAGVAAAQANLEKIKAGASVEDIQVSEQQLVKARNDLASLKLERDSQIQSLREADLNAINNGAFSAYTALDVVYNYFFNPNTTADLLISDSQLYNQLEMQYFKLKSNLDNLKSQIDLINSQSEAEVLIAISDQLIVVLSEMNSWLNSGYNLTNNIIINNTYSQSDKDSIKTGINSEQTTINSVLTTLQSAKSNLQTSADSYSKQIQAAENNIEIYQAQLNLKSAGARDFEIRSAEAQVNQAKAQLNKVLADLADYSLVAPINGVVTKVNFNLGEQVAAGQPVVKIFSAEGFEVNVDIPESDIAKIKVGDSAFIELDAFGSDRVFTGKVSFINPGQTIIQDVTYYRTKVSFNENSTVKEIKPGMTADIDIRTEEKTDVLYIPQRAVKIREATLGEVPEKYVEVLIDEQQVEERAVEVGIRGDDGLVEVISGLFESEEVVIFKEEK